MLLADGAGEFLWPEGALLIFRGTQSAQHFCIGGDLLQADCASGDLLAGSPMMSRLLERLRDARMPKMVVCHGATRGGGMLFPCLGTIVLAHENATFGFPEIRGGMVPSVVSVAAKLRLRKAACDWLFCTGDAVAARTAERLRLVDFVGSWEQLEAEVGHLVEHFHEQSAMHGSHDAPLNAEETLQLEADSESSMVRLFIAGDAVNLGLVCRLLSLLIDEMSSLRAVVLQARSKTQSTLRPSPCSAYCRVTSLWLCCRWTARRQARAGRCARQLL